MGAGSVSLVAGLGLRLGVQRAQVETLHLPARGLRELVDKLDPARIFEWSKTLPGEFNQFLGQVVTSARRITEHAERLWLDQLVFIRCADHSCLDDSAMSGERGFDLERSYPHAADFEHVVASAAEKEIAVLVAIH